MTGAFLSQRQSEKQNLSDLNLLKRGWQPYVLMAWRWCVQGTERWHFWPEGHRWSEHTKHRRTSEWGNRSRNVEENTETRGISWTCCCPYMSPILIQVLIIFTSETLRRIPFSLCTEDVWAGSQKALFSYLLNPYCFMEAPLLASAKHTPVRSFSVQTTLCWVCNPPPETPPRKPPPEGIWWDVPHPSWRSFIW